MTLSTRSSFGAALILALAGSALGGQTLTSGGATYSTGAAPTAPDAWGPASDLLAPSTGTDQLYQDWWWLRVGNETRESALMGPGTWTSSPSGLAFDTTQSGLDAHVTWQLSGGAGGLATLIGQLRLSNRGSSPVNVSAFHYADIDVNGSWYDDVASVAAPGVLRFTDAGGPSGQQPYTLVYSATPGATFGVGEMGSLITALTDSSPTNFNGSLAGLSGSPTDLAAGWQWNFEVPAGGEVTIGYSLALIPSPGSAGAVLGAAGLLCLRRRRG
jgi:hypothetical protein